MEGGGGGEGWRGILRKRGCWKKGYQLAVTGKAEGKALPKITRNKLSRHHEQRLLKIGLHSPSTETDRNRDEEM